jgi:hypothetical protein
MRRGQRRFGASLMKEVRDRCRAGLLAETPAGENREIPEPPKETPEPQPQPRYALLVIKDGQVIATPDVTDALGIEGGHFDCALLVPSTTTPAVAAPRVTAASDPSSYVPAGYL